MSWFGSKIVDQKSMVQSGVGTEPVQSSEVDQQARESEQISNDYPTLFRSQDSRLSTPFPARLPLAVTFSLIAGFLLGASKGGARAAYRFRAENAHRLPTTRKGWYLYHKSKNYHSIIGGVTEGLQFGTRLSVWAVLFVGSEEAVDQLRGGGDPGHNDVASTLCAGMATMGLYSWKNGRDLFTAAKMARTGLKVSLAYGIAQDLMSLVRGRPPLYIVWLRKRFWDDEATVES